jgi:hypothetical protein
MSTIIASNVSDGTLSIPTTFVTNGSAKAWVNFDGTGTIAARDSFNVSSLTDNGTGDYTVNFTNAFGAGDYAALASGGYGDDSTRAIKVTEDGTFTSSATRVVCVASTFGDSARVMLSCAGDLA